MLTSAGIAAVSRRSAWNAAAEFGRQFSGLDLDALDVGGDDEETQVRSAPEPKPPEPDPEPDPELEELARGYDDEQRRRGDERRAYRY